MKARHDAAIHFHQHGGRLSELDESERAALRRRWPGDPSRRMVTIRISSFSGIVPWASHYTLDIREEHNSFIRIDESGKKYAHEFWDDDEGRGFDGSLRFNSYETAYKVARAIVEVMFSDAEAYEVRWPDSGTTRKQFNKKARKGKDGD